MIKPYEKMTVKTLWTDPHIAKHMLKHHLSFADDIASRKYDIIERTVDFIWNELGLSPGSKLCDFGCGPGLYTNLHQQRGAIVTGVDFSAHSLAYAKSQNADVNYVEGNYTEVYLGDTYDVITMIYCDFSALSDQGRSAVLNNVRRHLKPGGIFFFDVHNVHWYDSIEEGRSTYQETDGFYMNGPATIDVTVTKYSGERIVLDHIVAKGARTVELFNWLKVFTEGEIKDLLNHHGFSVCSFHDTAWGIKDSSSEHRLIIAQRNN